MKITRREKVGKTKKALDSIDKYFKEQRNQNIPVEFIGSGSTNLNLVLSQNTGGGWGRGRIHNIVGDGSSGKTLLALEECFWFFKYIREIKSFIFPKVKDIEICFDKGEGVMDFPVADMYGSEFYKSVDWSRSPHFESMCRRFVRKMNALKKGQALLYIIDSWDSFKSYKSQKAFLDSVKDDSELKGDYGLAIQKYASDKFFPSFCDTMDNNGKDATLCIISQVRSKIGITFGKKQYRAGGKALDFYTHQVLWLSEVEKLSATRLKEKKTYGIKVKGYVDRSKVALPYREGEFTIIFGIGIDDVRSMIDYVYKGKKTFKFGRKSFSDKEAFIRYIEKNDLEEKLRRKTAKKWFKVENIFKKEILGDRKRRF